MLADPHALMIASGVLRVMAGEFGWGWTGFWATRREEERRTVAATRTSRRLPPATIFPPLSLHDRRLLKIVLHSLQLAASFCALLDGDGASTILEAFLAVGPSPEAPSQTSYPFGLSSRSSAFKKP